MVRSVMLSSPVTSKANRLRFPSIIRARLKSVSFEQFVRVNRSTLLQPDRGCNVPSLTSFASADRFKRLIRL